MSAGGRVALKHTFASRLVAAGVDLRMVQELVATVRPPHQLVQAWLPQAEAFVLKGHLLRQIGVLPGSGG